MSKTKLSLIVPCYNEEFTLRNCVNKIQKLNSDSLEVEIVIVDDCSRDKSREIAIELQKEFSNIKLCFHDVNKGKGAALRTGFLEANGDFVGIQDADEEYNPMEYLTMLQPMIENNADVVFGSRYLKPDTRRVLYFWHTWMNKGLTLATNMFTNLDITDMETCYKLFRKDVIRTIAPQLKEERFGFEPEVTILVAKGKYRVYECAISYNPRTFEEGKKIGWKDGVRALYCIIHYGGSFAPLPMQLLLYLFIGAISALMNIGIFISLGDYCTFDAKIIISFIVAAILNYFLSISILFQHKSRWSTLKEVFIYILVIAFMGGVDFYSAKYFASYSGHEVSARVFAAAVGFFANFFLRKYLVF